MQDQSIRDLGPCVEWAGPFNNKGYGKVGKLYAHRVAYESAVGPIPPGMLVCHRCDNPRCVRPEHLFLGTHADNTHDMWSKGRQRTPFVPGQSPSARLTPDQVRAIRRLYKPHTRGLGPKVLARVFRVNETTIRQILHGDTWRHVT